MKRLFLLAFLTLAGSADAATLTLTFPINSPPSTAIACTLSSSLPPAPVAPGTLVYSCSVAPASWSGGVILSSPTLAVASLSGNTFNLVVGATPLGAGNYTEVVTTTP